MRKSVLVIACGALAREITVLKQTNGWGHLHLKCTMRGCTIGQG